MLWTAQRCEPPARAPAPVHLRVRFGAAALLVLVLAQVYLGALVAGLRAGYVFNTWPAIDGAFVPASTRLFFDAPLWRNFFENALTVQFDHRMLAYLIFVCALLHAFDVGRGIKSERSGSVHSPCSPRSPCKRHLAS